VVVRSERIRPGAEDKAIPRKKKGLVNCEFLITGESRWGGVWFLDANRLLGARSSANGADWRRTFNKLTAGLQKKTHFFSARLRAERNGLLIFSSALIDAMGIFSSRQLDRRGKNFAPFSLG